MSTLSLRHRLLIATVAIAGLGLLAADTATYALLRSSLLGRVDEQLNGARGFATREIFEGPSQLRFERERGRPTGPVTYAALLDPSGRTFEVRSFGFGPEAPPPDLPSKLPGSLAQTDDRATRLFTTDAIGASLRYRVLATRLAPRQGTIVVAFPLGDVDATLRRLILVEGIVTILVLGAVAGVALWLVRVGLRPLTEMERAAADIAAGDLTRRVEPSDEHTEVGRLGRALNAMLEKIEAAFAERRASEDRLRRFVADASHELRTPLTSIRGYAELFRHGAEERPEDLQKSMRRIEEESSRMGTLVEELLLLARLDQGRPLELAPVDLAQVARDAVADARAVQPDRPIEADCEQPLVVEGDDARLRQVVANLLSNALEHTPPGTRVRVRTEAGDEAMLEVSDEGPGIEDEHAGRVFDRFFRVDPVRARENGGVGLGLAIVDAIVRAHGGRVTLESAPGEGARFAVFLPLGARAAAL